MVLVEEAAPNLKEEKVVLAQNAGKVARRQNGEKVARRQKNGDILVRVILLDVCWF